MKNVITGISFALVSAAAFAAQMGGTARSLGQISGKTRSLMAYVGLYGVWSKKNLKITTDAKTTYRAGYLYAPEGTNALAGDWGTDQPAGYANDGNSRVLGVHHTGVASLGGLVPATANTAFFVSGDMPRRWHFASDNNNRLYGVNADDVTPANVRNMTFALFGPNAGAAMPANKAWVQESAYAVHGQNVTELEFSNWGLRLELGLGYRIMDELSLFLAVGRKFEFENKNAKNSKDDISVETRGTDKKFRAANQNADLTAKLDLASFAYNNNLLFSKVKVSAKVKETFGVTGGVDWRPCPMLSLSLTTGVRRYDVEVLYQNGDYAYPGTTAYFQDAYLKSNGRFKLLSSQEDESRRMTGVEWPVVFGAAVRLVVMGMHCIGVGVDYAAFESKLSVAADKSSKKTDDNDKAKPSVLTLSNPYEAAAATDIKTGTGIHQFTPSGDVVNTITTTLEVKDLSVSASYVLTL